MSSIKYDTEQGVLYTMLNGVPHKLVTETELTKEGVKVIAKYVPAPVIGVSNE